MKLSLTKRGNWGRWCYLSFFQAKSVLPMMVMVMWSPIFISVTSFSIFFIPLYCWEGGVQEQLGGHLEVSQGHFVTGL